MGKGGFVRCGGQAGRQTTHSVGSGIRQQRANHCPICAQNSPFLFLSFPLSAMVAFQAARQFSHTSAVRGERFRGGG